MRKTSVSYPETHRVFRYKIVYRGAFLKCVLTSLYCTEHNENNTCHSDVHKSDFYKIYIYGFNFLRIESQKILWVHYVI